MNSSTKGISELSEGNYFCIRVDEVQREMGTKIVTVQGLLISLVIWRQVSVIFFVVLYYTDSAAHCINICQSLGLSASILLKLAMTEPSPWRRT